LRISITVLLEKNKQIEGFFSDDIDLHLSRFDNSDRESLERLENYVK